MKKITSFLLALLFLFSLSLPVFAEKDAIYDLSLDSQGVYIFNPETGSAIYEKAENARTSPASTTKIVTALVVLEECADPKNTFITTPDPSMFSYIVEEGGVHMQLLKGEIFSVYDLLLGMMMNSFCDAAELLAYHFGGESVEAFVEKMNRKAADLGLENSHFENPHGLYEPDHYSSPKDIAIFLSEAAKIDLFREIISTRNYQIPATAQSPARDLRYTVSIFYESNSYYLDAFVGGKSGYTSQAGRCLATLSEKDGVSYVSVLLGANLDRNRQYPGNMAWIETHTLISYAYEHYEVKSVLKKGDEIAQIAITDSETKIPAVAGEEILVLTRKDTDPTYRVELPDFLSAPEVENGKEVGKATLLFNEEDTGKSYPLVLKWDGVPIVTKSVLEKGAEGAADAVSGIFKTDKVFTVLLILLLILIAVCIPAMKITQNWHKKKSHRPKH